MYFYPMNAYSCFWNPAVDFGTQNYVKDDLGRQVGNKTLSIYMQLKKLSKKKYMSFYKIYA